MPALPLRTDFDAKSCRLAARHAGDASQARRLLSIAAIYDGAGRDEAATLGSVTVQIVCDWVKKFNAHGPEGLINRKPPGKPPKLTAVLPACNIQAMNLHLVEISAEVAPGRHAVLLLDQAGWHTSARLKVPANITLLPLPPKCPELNPAENVWQFIRDNWLSNRIFKSYEDILDHCCFAWNKLIDQPWRIMSIGLRDWAHAS